MNLTFIFDGYLAETTLESSFQLFVFDGYLIYGEVPPPERQVEIDDVGKKVYAPIVDHRNRVRELIDQDQEEFLILCKIFIEKCLN